MSRTYGPPKKRARKKSKARSLLQERPSSMSEKRTKLAMARTRAAKKGWETRRARKLAAARTRATKKGWETRRVREAAKAAKRKKKSKPKSILAQGMRGKQIPAPVEVLTREIEGEPPETFEQTIDEALKKDSENRWAQLRRGIQERREAAERERREKAEERAHRRRERRPERPVPSTQDFLPTVDLEDLLARARAKHYRGRRVTDVRAVELPGGGVEIVGQVDVHGEIVDVRAYEIVMDNGTRWIAWARAESLDRYTPQRAWELYPLAGRETSDFYSGWIAA